MRKVYHLGSCSTCKRIIKELDLKSANFEFQEIKSEPITGEQLDEMKELTGSYKALFSRIARKYRALKLGEKKLSEADYRHYILEEYTFLKRPVIIIDGQIFVGNSKKVVANVADELSE